MHDITVICCAEGDGGIGFFFGVKQWTIFYKISSYIGLSVSIFIFKQIKGASFRQGLALCHLFESYRSRESTRLEKSFEIECNL